MPDTVAFTSVSVPEVFWIPPPELSDTVTFVMVSVPEALRIPSPELSDIALSASVSAPEALWIPPPELPSTVTLVSVSAPEALRIPSPELSDTVTFVSVSVPETLWIPPPELPDIVTFVSVSAPEALWIAPPGTVDPPVSVRCVSDTSMPWSLINTTRLWPEASSVTPPIDDASMVNDWSMYSSRPPRIMVPPERPVAKVTSCSRGPPYTHASRSDISPSVVSTTSINVVTTVEGTSHSGAVPWYS